MGETRTSNRRAVLAGLGGLGATSLAGCVTQGQKQGQVRVDRQVEARASAFESFMRNTRGIDATFSGSLWYCSAIR